MTPTKEISEYLEEDLITTDAAYPGTVLQTHQRTDIEHKRISNTPIGPKRPYAILLAIIFGLALAVLGVYLLYENGSFDSFTSMIPSFEGISFAPPLPSNNDLVKKYPTPQAAKAAIDRGEVSLSQFPPQFQEYIKSVETPKVENKVELGG